jgi:hypothetical protein
MLQFGAGDRQKRGRGEPITYSSPIGSVRFRFIDVEAASFCRAFPGLSAGVSNRELSKKLNQFATCIG